MTKLPLVVVRWNDAWTDGTDPVNMADAAASHKPKPIITIGWVLKDDDVGISLANEHYAEEDTYRGRTFIIRSMIASVTHHTLTKARPKKGKKDGTSVPQVQEESQVRPSTE